MNSRNLISIASILHILMYFYAAPEHAFDESWPIHARFHIIQAIFWLVGLDLTAILISFSNNQHSQKFTFWVLAVIFVTSHLGYFISMGLLPEGRPPELSSHMALLVPLIIYLVGLIKLHNQKR